MLATCGLQTFACSLCLTVWTVVRMCALHHLTRVCKFGCVWTFASACVLCLPTNSGWVFQMKDAEDWSLRFRNKFEVVRDKSYSLLSCECRGVISHNTHMTFA